MKYKHLIGILLAFGCQPLYAVTVGFHFEATISQIAENVSDEPGAADQAWIRELRENYGVGAKVSGNYFYDSDVSPSAEFVDGSASEKRYPIQSADISMKGFSGQAKGRDITVSDSFYEDWDAYVVFSIIDNDMQSSGTLAKLWTFGLSLLDPAGNALSNSILGSTPPNMDDYSERLVTLSLAKDLSNINANSYSIYANLDSLKPISSVPLPEGLWLLISGLGMLGGLKGVNRNNKSV